MEIDDSNDKLQSRQQELPPQVIVVQEPQYEDQERFDESDHENLIDIRIDNAAQEDLIQEQHDEVAELIAHDLVEDTMPS